MLKTKIDWLKGHYEYTDASFIHIAIAWFKVLWENLSSEELNKLIQTHNMVMKVIMSHISALDTRSGRM